MNEEQEDRLAKRLNGLQGQMNSIQHCYTVLHNDFMIYLQKVHSEINKIVTTFREGTKDWPQKQEGHHTWISNHLKAIEERLDKIEQNHLSDATKKVRIRVEVEGQEDEIAEGNGDITHVKCKFRLLELLREESERGEELIYVLQLRYPEKGIPLTYAKIGKKLGLSATRVGELVRRALQSCFHLHNRKEINIKFLPAGLLKDALLAMVKD
jgi:hypothetical protein